jgi:hypothetical protein
VATEKLKAEVRGQIIFDIFFKKNGQPISDIDIVPSRQHF